MLTTKITRKEFLKIAGFGIFTIFILPAIRRLNLFRRKNITKEARYYKRLAG